MKVKLMVFFCSILAFTTSLLANDNQKNLIEGKMLFRIEKANWIGSDLLREKMPEKMDSIGGYISYINDANKVVNVFFSRFNKSQVLAKFIFDSIPNVDNVFIESDYKEANTIEKQLIDMRLKVFKMMMDTSIHFFKFYKNINFNVVPLINDSVRKVVVLSGGTDNKNIYLGNDYEIIFDDNNNIIDKKELHKTLIPIPFRGESPEKKLVTSVHSHILGDEITASDICTLLLYKDLVEWKEHIVIGEKFVTFFRLSTATIATVPKDSFFKFKEK